MHTVWAHTVISIGMLRRRILNGFMKNLIFFSTTHWINLLDRYLIWKKMYGFLATWTYIGLQVVQWASEFIQYEHISVEQIFVSSFVLFCIFILLFVMNEWNLCHFYFHGCNWKFCEKCGMHTFSIGNFLLVVLFVTLILLYFIISIYLHTAQIVQ